MKKLLLNVAMIVFVATAFTSCKDEKKDATTGEEKDAVAATDSAVDYEVDTEMSVINWMGEKPTGTHTGTIKLSNGTLAVNNEMIEAGKFNIDMNSIENQDLEGEAKANLESHLKGTVEGKEGDFFNVNKYPDATFELTGVTTENGKTMVNGNLTMKEKTNNISFPAAVTFAGDNMTLKSEKFMIDRTKWDVNYGSKSLFDNLGDKFISDNIELQIELQAKNM